MQHFLRYLIGAKPLCKSANLLRPKSGLQREHPAAARFLQLGAGSELLVSTCLSVGECRTTCVAFAWVRSGCCAAYSSEAAVCAMLLLFETAAGFALFKVLKEGKLKETEVRRVASARSS